MRKPALPGRKQKGKTMKSAQVIESFIRLIAVGVAFTLICTAVGCAQMMEHQRSELGEALGIQLRAEVELAAEQTHDQLLEELRAHADAQVSRGIDLAVASARQEAASVIAEAGVDPSELRSALVKVAEQEGIDTQALIDRSMAAAKRDLTKYTNQEIDTLGTRLDDSNKEIGAKAEEVARAAVVAKIETFEEAATKTAAKAVGAATNTGILTGGGYSAAIAVALGIGQWFLNRRKKQQPSPEATKV